MGGLRGSCKKSSSCDVFMEKAVVSFSVHIPAAMVVFFPQLVSITGISL
jgi:hypothetical protein